MSGVWKFKNNGVFRLVENPQAEASSDGRQGKGSSSKKKVLVHLPTGQVVSSYTFLEQILTGLGWERYYDGEPDLYQFHKHNSIDLISLPRDFSKFNSVHMYDIVVKTPNVFHVRDNWVSNNVPATSWKLASSSFILLPLLLLLLLLLCVRVFSHFLTLFFPLLPWSLGLSVYLTFQYVFLIDVGVILQLEFVPLWQL